MGFLAFAVIAIVVLPILMLLQKGLQTISKDKKIKEDMKKDNKDLGRAWVMFLVIIVIVLLYAVLTSCNGQSVNNNPTYSSSSQNSSESLSHDVVQFSSASEMEEALNKLRDDRNSVDDTEWEQICNKQKHYRVNYRISGAGYSIRVYNNMYNDGKDYDWITKGLVKRYFKVLSESYGNCKVDSLGVEDFILTAERLDKGVADKHTCHIKDGSVTEEILDFKSENVFEGVLQVAIKDTGSNYLGNQDKVVNTSKGYTVFINENGPLGKQLKWAYN